VTSHSNESALNPIGGLFFLEPLHPRYLGWMIFSECHESPAACPNYIPVKYTCSNYCCVPFRPVYLKATKPPYVYRACDEGSCWLPRFQETQYETVKTGREVYYVPSSYSPLRKVFHRFQHPSLMQNARVFLFVISGNLPATSTHYCGGPAFPISWTTSREAQSFSPLHINTMS
jgi:hypothetical protein